MATHLARLLGRLEVQVDNQPRVLLAGQVAQFLGYLAYCGSWVRRDEVIYLFWPDQEESVARRNLRKLLHRARQKVSGIEAEGESLRWLVSTDVQAWQDAVERRDWLAASSHYRGPLLDGLEGEGAGEYGAWLEGAREGCKRGWQRALFGQAEVSGGYPVEALPLLRRLLEVDPLDEEVVHAYLHCLAAAGRYDEMSRVYKAFAKRLGDELEIEPGEDLRALVERFRDQAKATLETLPGVEAPKPERPASHREPSVRAAIFLNNVGFVGRERELARLHDHLAFAQGGQRNAVAIEGEAGVGKTRLVEEFLATSAPEQVFRGRCFERELAAPLEPIHSALAALADGTLPRPVGDGRFWTTDPSDRSIIHQGLMAQLLRAARESRGAVLFIDDVQWADAATLEFLSYAVKRVRGEPVLVVLSFRREDRRALESWLLPLAERRTLDVLSLGRLEAEPLQLLLKNLSTLKAQDLLWLTELLLRESEGNAFYVVEYLRWLHDSGVIELDAAQRIAALRREHLAKASLPEGVRALLWARYRSLDEASCELLDLAAVIGRSFALGLLERASGRDPLALWSTLEPLIAAGLVTEVSSEMSSEHYSLSHDKLRQTVYESIGPPIKRSLHARVAEASQLQNVDHAELAHHYLRANAWAEAFDHLQIAARQAEQDFAWNVALQGYTRALELSDRLPDADRKRFSLLQARERLLENMDRRPERAATAHQLTALAERIGDPKLVAEAQVKRMAVLLRSGQKAEAEEAQHRALNLFAELGNLAGEASVYRELAYTAWTNSDYQAMLEANFEALRLYQAVGNRWAEAATAWNIAQAYRRLAQHERALTWAETAAAMYRESTDLLGEYMRLDTLAWVHSQRGEVKVSVSYVEQLLPICEKLNDKHLSVEKNMILGQYLLNDNEPEQALKHFQTAAQLGAAIGDPRHEGYPLMSLGATLERLNNTERAAHAYARAAQLLETAYTVSDVADEHIAQADALTLLASVLHKKGEVQEALAAFDTAEAIFEHRGAWSRLSKLLMERAALYWHQKRYEPSIRDYEQARHYAKEVGQAEREAAALASLGVVLRDTGRYQESIDLSLEALGKLKVLKDQQAEGYVLASLASSYRLVGKLQEARACLEASLELRRRLGDAEGEAKVASELSELNKRSGGLT
jgi:tetratricopeptide (TPR) repeat protein/DNA-binding SARP family transcriptional activator